jgi:hypothetical protein
VNTIDSSRVTESHRLPQDAIRDAKRSRLSCFCTLLSSTRPRMAAAQRTQAPAASGHAQAEPDSISNGSDFLLLTTSPSPDPRCILPLPRPRFLPVLQVTSLADLAFSLIYGVPLARQPGSRLWVAVLLSLGRAVLVLGVVSSVRVRERGWIILAQLMVGCLPPSPGRLDGENKRS